MIKYVAIAFVAVTFCFQEVNAQFDAMYTHYSFNTLSVNPGYAGSRDAITLTALNRSQWVNFEGAPTTQTFTAHMPLSMNQMGVGINVINDNIGPINISSLYADYSYDVKVTKNTKLALGLKAGMNVIYGKLHELHLDQENDPKFATSLRSDILPNFGFGLYYHAPRWYVGASTPKILENDFQSNSGVLSGKEQRHYFVIGGAAIDLGSSNLVLKPTSLLKVTQGAPVELDMTLMVIYNEQLEMGFMFRTQAATGILIGYNIMKNLRAGYAFDWSFVNRTLRDNNGTHEIMIRYDFVKKDEGKIISPRFF
ncbi:MAG: type IX secretion system membrane protein PorP/SprF [Flavobacteriales bacterium]|nr:type IX secretion system membrane protein PorP/SprF [Flavobacteriales bacterium]